MQRNAADGLFTRPSSIKGRQNAYKFTGGRFLRVTFKEDPDNILVVTVTVRKRSFKG